MPAVEGIVVEGEQSFEFRILLRRLQTHRRREAPQQRKRWARIEFREAYRSRLGLQLKQTARVLLLAGVAGAETQLRALVVKQGERQWNVQRLLLGLSRRWRSLFASV